MQCNAHGTNRQNHRNAGKSRLTDATLFVVATPIGNRDDLSPRARDVLANVHLIASEDTRRTGRLLSHFGIEAQQLAFHEHNETEACETILAELTAGRSVALVSDAGTPLISDPGYRLVNRAHAAGMTVSPIPGPSALLAALSVAGLPTDRFCFEGFLPAKAVARRKRLETLLHETRTLVFYEAVHRIHETVSDARDLFGDDRRAFIGRELSKLHEQCVLSTLAGRSAQLDENTFPGKGEFVLIIEGAAAPASPASLDTDGLLRALAPLLPQRQVVDIVAAVSSERRNALYQRLLDLKAGTGSKDPSD